MLILFYVILIVKQKLECYISFEDTLLDSIQFNSNLVYIKRHFEQT